MAGDIIGVYGRELSVHNFFLTYATAFTLSGMLLGYVVGLIAIPRFISQQVALRICTVFGMLCTIISVFTSGTTSFIFVALLGIANSLLWPAIFPLGIKGLWKVYQNRLSNNDHGHSRWRRLAIGVWLF